MNKWPDWVLTAAATSCVALMCVRAASVLHNGPYVYNGLEEESLFAVWKWLNGQPVYANAFAPPFAQSYFNWLFYWTYGAFSSIIIRTGELDFLWLPTITRCLTLILTLISSIVVYALLSPLSLIRRVAGSAIIAFNPLIGFWGVAARPDIGALACDLVGLWCVRNAERSKASVVWLGAALLAFYCAWAFKQTYMAAFAATGLYLFLRGKQREALWFGGVAFSAIGFTCIIGTDEYRYAVLLSQLHIGLFPSIAGANVTRAFLKAPFFVFGLVSVIICIRRDRGNLLALWASISTLVMLAASGKTGAVDNYFFEPAAMCGIMCLLDGRRVTAAAAAQIISPVLIMAGVVGVVFPRPEPELALLKPGLAKMSGPVVVTELWANLPWFQEKPPHFVSATMYAFDKSLGRKFAFDGVGGMIRTGRIRVVVCPRDKVDDPFDGVVPASLRKVGEDSKWAYFATGPAQ